MSSIKKRIIKGRTANIFDGQFERTQHNGTTGEKTSSTTWVSSVNKFAVDEGETYAINAWSTDTSKTIVTYIYKWDSNGTFLGSLIADTAVPCTVTIPSGTAYIDFQLAYSDRSTTYTDTFTCTIVEDSTAPPSYIPYIGNLILRQSVPGFRLVQEYAGSGRVDLGTLTWLIGSANNGYVYTSTAYTDLKATATGAAAIMYCDGYNAIVNTIHDEWNSTQVADMSIGQRSSNVICIKNSAFIDLTAAEVKAKLSGVYLYYQRSTDTTWGPVSTYVEKIISRVLVEKED